MDNNCQTLMLNHLLKDNLWYSHKILLTLFLALFISMFYCYHFEKQHYLIKMLIIPILSFVIIYYLLEVLAMAMVDKKELEYQVEKCQRLFKDPNIDGKMNITGKDVENYTGIDEGTVSKLDDDIKNMGNSNRMSDNIDEMSDNTVLMTGSNKPNEIGDEEETPLEITTQNDLEENFYNNTENTEEWKNVFEDTKCQMGYGALCSGQKVSNNLVTAIPGPQWQPQTAQATSERLINEEYVPSKCLYKPAGNSNLV